MPFVNIPPARPASGGQEPLPFAAAEVLPPVPTDGIRPAATPVTPQPMPSPGAAPSVLVQIAHAVTTAGSARTDLLLSPEELGRVRLSMTMTDGTVAVLIQAERPETADLLRRNLDQLAQDFRDLGYDDITFAFQSSEDGSRDAPEWQGREAMDAAPSPQAVDPTAGVRPREQGAGNLDLRI